MAPPPLAKPQASAQTLFQLRQPSLPHSTSSSSKDTAQGAPPPREDFPQSRHALCCPTTWVRIPVLLLDSYVLGQEIEPHFPHLYHGNNNGTYLAELFEGECVKYLAENLAHSKH